VHLWQAKPDAHGPKVRARFLLSALSAVAPLAMSAVICKWNRVPSSALISQVQHWEAPMTNASHLSAISSPLIRLGCVALCLFAVAAVPMLGRQTDAKASLRWDDPVTLRGVGTQDVQDSSTPSPEQAARLQRIERTAKAWNHSWVAASQD
jgi:hypothetical protein